MRNNAVKLLKHTQELCLNFENIFETFSNKISYNNLLKKQQVGLNDFIDNQKGSYIKDYFFEHNGYLKVFRMLICIGDSEEYIPYKHICTKLQIDKNIPLILIYGIIKPVNSIEESFSQLEFMMDTCSGFSTQDEMKFDWYNFENIRHKLACNENICIQNKPWTDKKAWDKYFTEAIIRIKDIFDIQDAKDIEELIRELEAMKL